MSKILVCEDNEANIEAAKTQLAEHDVFVARTLTEAMGFLGNQAAEDVPYYAKGIAVKGDIDVLLTDMHMSGGSIPCLYELGPETAGVGVLIALRAAVVGIRHVGLMSDANHHQDAMTAGIDMVSGTWFTTERSLRVNDSVVVITMAEMVFDNLQREYVKNWHLLLEGLLAID
jgi:CheY-like chemotaxis protein